MQPKTKEATQRISSARRSEMGDERLWSSLKELGETYEPDLAAIYQRVHATRQLVHHPVQSTLRRILAALALR